MGFCLFPKKVPQNFSKVSSICFESVSWASDHTQSFFLEIVLILALFLCFPSPVPLSVSQRAVNYLAATRLDWESHP